MKFYYKLHYFLIIFLSVNEICSLKRKSVLKTETYDVVNMIKRPETYYTQGLIFDEQNNLIESGGLYGSSVLVKMQYPSLKILKKINLHKKYFAEGIAKCGNSLYQLTWNERKILKYSLDKFELVNTLELDPQLKSGWGLASLSSQNVIATDGSNKLFILDCLNNLKVVNTINVTLNNMPLDKLNALVVVDNYVYANRYYDSRVFKINPQNGKVDMVYDFNNLVGMEINKNTLTNTRLHQGDVLNGIAYNKNTKLFVLTGKKWGYYYEVVLR